MMLPARLTTHSSADSPPQMGAPPAQLCESGTPIPPLHRTHSSTHLPGLTNQTIATATGPRRTLGAKNVKEFLVTRILLPKNFFCPTRRKKENRQPKGGMGGRYTATTQGFFKAFFLKMDNPREGWKGG